MWFMLMKKLSYFKVKSLPLISKLPAVMVPLNLISLFCKKVMRLLSGLMITFNESLTLNSSTPYTFMFLFENEMMALAMVSVRE